MEANISEVSEIIIVGIVILPSLAMLSTKKQQVYACNMFIDLLIELIDWTYSLILSGSSLVL